jgi:hypothetical protein
MVRRLSLRIAFAALIICAPTLSERAVASPLLIDDFDVEQSLSPTAALRTSVSSPQIFGGTRVLTGIEAPTVVTGGQMRIGPSGSAAGLLNTSWAGPAPLEGGTPYWQLSIDLTGYSEVEIKVAEIAGTVRSRILIGSGFNITGRPNSYLHESFFSSMGTYRFKFSEFVPEHLGVPFDVQDINNVVLTAEIEPGESIAFDSIGFVPEPAPMSLLAIVIIASSLSRSRRTI